jgi:hypothetical protein
MYKHSVVCSHPTCSELAGFKVAAHWSDGRFSELKTYGFACSRHLATIFQDAEGRRLNYPLGPGEASDEIAIYRFEVAMRERPAQRLQGLEAECRT